MKLSFPQITRSNEPFLFALYAAIRANEMTLIPWNEKQKTGFLQSQFQAQQQYYLSTYPQAEFQFINLDSEKIGRLYTCKFENENHIIDLTILPEYHGRGFGTEIISDILQKAEKPVQIYLASFNQLIYLSVSALKLLLIKEFTGFGNTNRNN